MKPSLRNALYLFSLSPAILVCYGNLHGGWLVHLNIIYSLFVLGTLEWIIPSVPSNLHSDKTDRMPQFILLLHVPFQILALSSLCYGIYSHVIQSYWIIGAALSTGLNSGSSAIVVAHELIHRKSKWQQAMGKLLLFSAGNLYFYVAHLKVHHKWVGTDKDHSTAHYGESLYQFFVRSASTQFLGSFHLEQERTHQRISLDNYVFRQVVLQFLLLVVLYLAIGTAAVLAYILQCVFANFLLEYINYVQHYGLVREEQQRVTEYHSWDCDRVVSRFVLVDLARHADHHYYASKPYHTLKNYESGPKLPTGYAGLFFIAAIPTLWRNVIHKRLND